MTASGDKCHDFVENEANVRPLICRKMKSGWVEGSLAVNHGEGMEAG